MHTLKGAICRAERMNKRAARKVDGKPPPVEQATSLQKAKTAKAGQPEFCRLVARSVIAKVLDLDQGSLTSHAFAERNCHHTGPCTQDKSYIQAREYVRKDTQPNLATLPATPTPPFAALLAARWMAYYKYSLSVTA
jgi:hypothetical protein